jgi:hypothetical protein
MTILTNTPYEFKSESWFQLNDYLYLLELLADEGVIDSDFYEQELGYYLTIIDPSDRLDFALALLRQFSPEETVLPLSPVNFLVKTLDTMNLEDIPAYLYFLDNDVEDLPKDFNALTYPDYFKFNNVNNEESVVNRQAYNDILKKTLDARNNNLDARKINTGMSVEDVATIAQRVETDAEASKRRDINFSPNSLVNAKVGTENIVDSVKLLKEKEKANKEEEQRIKLKFLKSDDDKPTQARMSLEDLLKDQNSDKSN